MDGVQTRQCPELKLFKNNLEKALSRNRQQIWSRFLNGWREVYSGHWQKLSVQTSTRARARCPSTTSGASARARARCPNLCSGTKKRLCSHWCPWLGSKSERGLIVDNENKLLTQFIIITNPMHDPNFFTLSFLRKRKLYFSGISNKSLQPSDKASLSEIC